jgi:hypothetical protein
MQRSLSSQKQIGSGESLPGVAVPYDASLSRINNLQTVEPDTGPLGFHLLADG